MREEFPGITDDTERLAFYVQHYETMKRGQADACGGVGMAFGLFPIMHLQVPEPPSGATQTHPIPQPVATLPKHGKYCHRGNIGYRHKGGDYGSLIWWGHSCATNAQLPREILLQI